MARPGPVTPARLTPPSHWTYKRANQTSGRTPQTSRNGGAETNTAFRDELKLACSCSESVPVVSVPSMASRSLRWHTISTHPQADIRIYSGFEGVPLRGKSEPKSMKSYLPRFEVPIWLVYP